MIKTPNKVIIAMSGGVDSSVAAALLAEEYDEVIGVMLGLWSDPSTENLCCTTDSMALAKAVANQIGIPFHKVDAENLFKENVVEYFINSYKRGDTPNPCIECNRTVRWDLLKKFSAEIGATYISTGHYSRLRKGRDGHTQLLRGLDSTKDQSYVLHGLSQETLSQTLFPLGEYNKTEIREIARNLSLPVADRPDSQDLCFVGNQGYRDFLIRHAPEVIQPGPVFLIDGKQIGTHQGLAFYTIGQRKGLGIAADQPYYVIEKDTNNNRLIVGTKDQLACDQARVEKVNWVSGKPPEQPFNAMIKIRYKARDEPGRIEPLAKDQVHIKFARTLKDITPGQSAVFYDGEVCLGGGTIQ